MSSQYNGLVFVRVYLCFGNSNEQSIYNWKQEIKLMIVCKTGVKGILVTIVTARPEMVYGKCNRRVAFVHQKTF